MGHFSIFWFVIIFAISCLIFGMVYAFLKEKKQKIVWAFACLSIFVYSGIGISYLNVDKSNIFYYVVFLTVLGLSFSLFSNQKIKITIRKQQFGYSDIIKDERFWNSKITKSIFSFVVILYILFRFLSMLYPVNHLSNISFEYDAINNLKNLTGENTSIFKSIAEYIKPLYYIGLVYLVKKVRYIACFLSFDVAVTLFSNSYFSRHEIIVIAIICLLLYFNGDLNSNYLTKSKKRKRIVSASLVLIPVLLYVMIALMETRSVSGESYNLIKLIESEINYPRHYFTIHQISPLVSGEDYFLHLLDSFIPLIPTPSYSMSLNISFSTYILGYGVEYSWFYILLPGIVGESILIFGELFFWVHAVILAFILSLIFRITQKNRYLIILFYYYVACVMKSARAGYEELSLTVLRNYIFTLILLVIIRFISNSLRYRQRNTV
jgi:hypothetical protein